ncbi:hypothetical protein ACOMHN_040978 [Nucella lapillus]
MKVYGSNGVSRGVWGARKRQQHVLKRCGVTHDNNTVETQVSVLWVAPKVPVMDNIQFKAIVVRNYTIFYNNILSRPLKPNYPSLSFDKIFQRLVAFANMKFNISLPSIPLPDPKMTSVLDLPKVTDTSGVKDTAIKVKNTSRATDSAVKCFDPLAADIQILCQELRKPRTRWPFRGKMSGVEGSGDQSCSKDKTEGQAPNAGASSNAAVQESLEDQLRLLSKQLNTSHWQQRNTAEDWVNTNPEAAAELKQIIAEKQAAQNPPPQ